jgi:C4-dicarboxylate-specific signal transduction histidine kinase
MSVREDVSTKSVPIRKLFPGAELLAAQSAIISHELTRQVAEQRALVRRNKKLARQLKASIDEMNESRDQFLRNARLAAVGNIAGSVSHEINNPVTGVMGYLAFVRKRNKDEALSIYLDKAIREVERIGRIAKSLLVFSRRSTQPALTPFDIKPSIENVHTLVGISLHEADVALTVRVPENLPLVNGRVDEFQQCLLNLLLNARDAVKDCTEKTVTLSVKKEKDKIHVIVSDTGTGVSPAAQEHLFQPFFTTKAAGQGSGLGLTVTQELMRHMGGSVTFDSHYSPGARFVLTLPVFEEKPQTDAGGEDQASEIP